MKISRRKFVTTSAAALFVPSPCSDKSLAVFGNDWKNIRVPISRREKVVGYITNVHSCDGRLAADFILSNGQYAGRSVTILTWAT